MTILERATSRVLAALLLTLATAGVGRGSEPVSEAPSFPGLGSRVRVTSFTRSGSLVGSLNGIEAKSLAVQAQDRSEMVVLARQDIRRLERSVRPSQKSKGALIGLGIGVAAGFGGTILSGSCCAVDEETLLFGSIYGAAAGAFGAVVGALVAPGERWADVSLDRMPSEGGRVEAWPRVQLRVVPMAGARRGLTLVASF